MKPHVLSFLGVLLAPCLGCFPLIHATATPPPARVGFVYVSPVGDAGWTYQHDQGRRDMEARLSGRVIAQIAVNIPEGPDAELVIRSMAEDGCKAIFTTSFGYMNQTVRVAAASPQTEFFHATGTKCSRNVSTYNARFYEGRYLCGVLAGRMSKSHVAGYVAAYPIPEVLQGINAFTQGMRSVDPKAEIRVVWVNAWYDPEKEREATLKLLSQGVDVITHHTDSTAVVEAVEQMHRDTGAWSIAYHSDMARLGPTSQLTACTHVWGDYYTRVVEQVLAGTWSGGSSTWGGLREGMVRLAPFNQAVPAEVRSEVADLQEQITSGRLHPFTGPVIAQDGTLKVAVGGSLTDAELNAMNYFVQGVSSPLR